MVTFCQILLEYDITTQWLGQEINRQKIQNASLRDNSFNQINKLILNLKFI